MYGKPDELMRRGHSVALATPHRQPKATSNWRECNSLRLRKYEAMIGGGTEEWIRRLLVEGEGPTVEYKSSLRWDYNQSGVNKELTKVIVRTLAAFLNSQGGALLIGVDDKGTLLDLEFDISTLGKKSLDGFELTLRSAVASHLGEEVDPHCQV